MISSDKSHQRRNRKKKVDGGENKWKLTEVNTGAMSRGQTKLIGKFKMAAGDVISIRN